jgi:outer membrane lipoprotein carrier protein
MATQLTQRLLGLMNVNSVFFLALLLIGPIALTQASSGDSTNELIETLDLTESLQGQFVQEQYSADGVLQVTSSGTFKMLRPGYFSWDISSPDSQLILVTPQFLWHLDRDLETLTRRPVSDSTAMSPLQLLGGKEDVLQSGFDVRKTSDTLFSITPKKNESAASAGFSSLNISLNKNVIAGMEIIDGLNQRIVITFQDVDKASVLTDVDFDFTPPDGVDLFYYDE